MWMRCWIRLGRSAAAHVWCVEGGWNAGRGPPVPGAKRGREVQGEREHAGDAGFNREPRDGGADDRCRRDQAVRGDGAALKRRGRGLAGDPDGTRGWEGCFYRGPVTSAFGLPTFSRTPTERASHRMPSRAVSGKSDPRVQTSLRATRTEPGETRATIQIG